MPQTTLAAFLGCRCTIVLALAISPVLKDLGIIDKE